MERCRLIVSVAGRVQGVGFRFATVEVARRFSVTGFVRNESDGSVRVEAEGSGAELDGFLAALKQSRVWAGVRRVHTSTEPATGEWRSFSISYI